MIMIGANNPDFAANGTEPSDLNISFTLYDDMPIYSCVSAYGRDWRRLILWADLHLLLPLAVENCLYGATLPKGCVPTPSI